MKKFAYIFLFFLIFFNKSSYSYGYEQQYYWEKCNITWKTEKKASKKIAKSHFKSINKINPQFKFRYSKANPDILIVSSKIVGENMGTIALDETNGRINKAYITIYKNYLKDSETYMHEIVHGIGLYWDKHNNDTRSLMSDKGFDNQKLTKNDIFLISKAFCGAK